MKKDDLLKSIQREDNKEQDNNSNNTYEEGLLFFLHIPQLLINN